jgi:hypothetical protein
MHVRTYGDSDFGPFCKIHSVHAFLDRERGPEPQMLNVFSLYSAIVLWFSHFRLKIVKQVPSKSGIFSLETCQYG